ncbi:hypothetical protein CRI94_02265 [Longibacter salinarum]|uniref:histidine kinase n=1 Tax=Longibacter salinarum TaxID=1850348 RepID=A0A2A8D2E6_9BACT|nr:PAS domain-containing protein [Longibacter salinarum]PEN15132.1 hypothetical protein CRI94_02265 [Longibacter salinarum]
MKTSPWKNERVPESFTAAIVVLDEDWRFRYVDPNAENVLKRSVDELIGRTIWSEFPEAVDTVFYREYYRAMEEGRTVRFEGYYEPLDLWVQVYAYPIEHGLTVVFQDITKRKVAEQDAERLEARNQAIIKAIPDDLYMISGAGVIVEAERGGVGPTDDTKSILGRSIDDVFPSGVARRFHDTITRVQSSGETRVMSYRLPASSSLIASREEVVEDDENSMRAMEARIVPVQGDGVLAIVRDVSTQRNLERQVLEVTRCERERIGRDLHDGIGSLLSGIAMMSSGLANAIEGGEDVSAEEVREISRLAKEGVSQARALSRGLNPIHVEPDRFVASIEEMASNMKTMTGVACYLDDPDDIQSLKSDVATQLYWITQEAVNNATRHADCSQIAVGVWIEEDDLLIRVRDDGKGLSEESRSGLGQQTMRYRAEVIGATLTVRNREPTPLRRAKTETDTDATVSSGVDVICRLPIWKAIPDVDHRTENTSQENQATVRS